MQVTRADVHVPTWSLCRRLFRLLVWLAPPVRCNVASRVCLRRPLLVTLRPGCCFPLWFL